MGRYLLCGKEAEVPFEVEELDIRLYTIEELCYYIYHNLPLIGDDFISERLLHFIRNELEMPETADKIERFYSSPSDQDSTLFMLLSEVGYYTEYEMQEFQNRLVFRRRKNGPERVRYKADSMMEKKRYLGAVRYYKTLVTGERDGRISPQFTAEVLESIANCYGKLCQFEQALEYLEKAYDQSGSERLLKKIYDVTVLSGQELPEKYFGTCSDARLAEWQQSYWNREAVCKSSLEENPAMQMFLHTPEVMNEELKQYVEEQKELYRGMLE